MAAVLSILLAAAPVRADLAADLDLCRIDVGDGPVSTRMRLLQGYAAQRGDYHDGRAPGPGPAPEEARAACGRAIARMQAEGGHPDLAWALEGRARAALALGDIAAATADLDRWAALGRSGSAHALLKAELLLRTGRPRTALMVLDAARDMADDPAWLPPIQQRRGLALCALGDTEGTADALSDWLNGAHASDALRVTFQDYLTMQGHFAGPSRTHLTPEARAAIADWAEGGCDDLAAQLLGPPVPPP